MGQALSSSVRHTICWETSQGFQMTDDFRLAPGDSEVHTTVAMLSAKEGHNQLNILIQKFLLSFGISLEAVDRRPISVLAKREIPDPARTGYNKSETHVLFAPTMNELDLLIEDYRWVFYFKILPSGANNGSTVQYHVFRKPDPLSY